ncbi:MAG TPA: PIN domain-containing protein [Candidatus Limnocylindria bacterium]|nr:PIN domain-containing protein [Candidatus Limnocylindria bacterium]
MALERAIPRGEAVLLDTSSLAAYLGSEPTSAIAAFLIDEYVRSGRNRAVVSAVSVTELLVRPIRGGHHDVGRSILEFLRTFANLDIVPVDLTVATIAAALRARDGMKVPDALIAASGLDRSAAVAISDDAGWPETLAHGATTMRVVALRSFLPFA